MKHSILTLIAVCLFGHTFAHYLWIDTQETAKKGQKQEVRVFYGEYTYGVIEKVGGEAFEKVNKFKLWLIDPEGNRLVLDAQPKEDHYLATFTPNKEGTYTLLLDNDEIDVLDYSAYDFGIFKTHYHAVAKVQVGGKKQHSHADNKEGITVRNLSTETNKIKLQLLYKNEVLPNHEVNVFVADQWSKTLESDEEGFVTFDLPWETTYLVEITKKEEVPGTYKDVPYEFVWHCVTLSIKK
ncbi:MAG: DUF4198 domain-containing protein [Bacteroidota bacterium]